MTADTLITILAITLLLTATLLWRLPVGTCKECSHCRSLELARERELEDQAGRLYGVPRCQSCDRYHARGEPHRR